MEVLSQAAKGFQNAGQDSFTLGRGVARLFIVLTDICSAATMEKGTVRVPLHQRISDGSIDKKFFSRRSNGKYVHDYIFRILELEWVSVVIIMDRGGLGYLCEFRDGDLSVCTKASVFDNFGELCAQGSVKKRDATPNLAAEGMA